jgi:hypothetical protein
MPNSAAARTARKALPAAALWPALSALWRAVRRDLGSFASLTLNNFFLFVALIAYGAMYSGVVPIGAFPFLLLLGFLLLFPLSADPLTKIPAVRLALWPLRHIERLGLRVAALVLSPILWLATFLLWRASRNPAALGLVALPLLTHKLAPSRWRPLRRIPAFGELMRKDLRQMLSVLDTWLAILLAAIGIATHARSVPGGGPGMASLVALALSTYAQCLFSLDGIGGLARYRLMPLTGWRILLAKDAAYLTVLTVLVVPIDLGAGLCFSLMALAIGHYPAMRDRLPVQRWRFTGGRLPFGILQMVAGATAAFAESEHGPVILIPAFVVCALSIWLSARYWAQLGN